MKNLTLRYGLYGATLMVLLFTAMQVIGNEQIPYHTAELIGYITIFLSLSFVFFGIRAYRDQQNGGSITFGKALQVGVGISLFPSIAMGLLTVILFLVKGDAMMEYYTKNMPVAEQQQMQANLALYSNPFFQGAVMFLTVFLIGLVIAIVAAMVLKRQATTT